jgi:hypothetical protein
MKPEISNAVIHVLRRKATNGNLHAIKTLAKLRVTSRQMRNKIGPMTRNEVLGLFRNRTIRNRLIQDAQNGRPLTRYPDALILYAIKKLAQNVANRGYRYTINRDGHPTQNGNRMTRRNLNTELRYWINAKQNMGNNYVNFPVPANFE